MGKVSPKDGQSKTPKQKRRSRSTTGKYLRPGALAQLRYTKVSAAKSCTDLGKKRVAVITSDETKDQIVLQNHNVCETPTILSPVRFCYGAMHTPIDVSKQKNLQMTPKTPGALECTSESRLESLPMDLLVKILCHLHHDQLKAVFHVSQKIRKAVIQARLFHFNYTTPDRMRQEMLRTMTPLPTDHWPFVSKEDGQGAWLPSPHTPKAPKHGPRPPSRLKFTEMRQIAAVLFQESVFPSRCLVPSVIPKPLCKSLGSNRVLFYEDELCQAVAQNKLR
ncbi:PREDICTED: F-box protein At4g35930-like [Nicotiana attenuata]|uniref:F-box protein n=1 Tax=Nicotiana attenuata TaxID=49451 RepID=A0A1J6I0E1_NICAT|nr:PREDICTED: F-box protein At4g35930-like [Nicotiana attenuata]XP_019253348.1 PREDICTED: F-box protein At4g35930-like [Nicotiana attenuata]XP_019253349.1 PREDICTED: F-box protein At4g35930-like [Nicotiana attenuata]OIS98557.1 f-box protein [Nicotiana attenuata]